MHSKKRLLRKSRLYVIIDKNTVKNKGPIAGIANKIKASRVDILQYRNKKSEKRIILQEAQALSRLFANNKTIFIINDYVDIAKIIGSDGIHIGQGDISIETVRRILGKDKIIGVSCHSLKQAIKAQNQGADYVSIGPIFPTPTKPEYKAVGLKLIKKIKGKLKIPFFAIGGINKNNINEILAEGAEGVAICRAVCQNKDIKSAVKNLKTALTL